MYRKQLEQKLFNLTYDMEMIPCRDQVWKEIRNLSTEELRKLVKKYEKEQERTK